MTTSSLVTAPDEQHRCCAVIDGHRCAHPTAFRVASTDGAIDDYTYVCVDHLPLVSGPGYIATQIERPGQQ